MPIIRIPICTITVHESYKLSNITTVHRIKVFPVTVIAQVHSHPMFARFLRRIRVCDQQRRTYVDETRQAIPSKDAYESVAAESLQGTIDPVRIHLVGVVEDDGFVAIDFEKVFELGVDDHVNSVRKTLGELNVQPHVTVARQLEMIVAVVKIGC